LPKFFGAKMKTIIFLLLVCYLIVCVGTIQAQNNASVYGTVKDMAGIFLPGVTLVLKGTNKGIATDGKGNFEINDIPSGDYIFIISAIGYKQQKRSITLTDRQRLKIEIQLEEDTQNLAEVVIIGKSQSREISEAPIAISSLSTQPVLAQALGAEELLKTTTGVVVRQNGGLGSNVNINLNGLSGQAVRIYYDGMPINVFGGGLQLNTIPIDALERVDVYKGVTPVEVGTDALGGGINLVPAKKSIDYLNASYTFGSFNTHRITFNSNKQLSERASISMLSYFNYSDNDYKMRNIRSITEQTLPNGSVVAGNDEFIDVRRFHNRHLSGYVEGAINWQNLKWADRLELGTSYAVRDDEIQHGAFIFRSSVGEATARFHTLTQRLDYRKHFFGDKLNLRYNGVFTYTRNQVNDSTQTIFNWRGERIQSTDASGAEVFANPTQRMGKNLSTAQRAIATYRIHKELEFTFTEFYRYTKIEGNDPVGGRLNIGGEPIDPNTIPSTLNRNVIGAELKGKLLKEKLIPVIFFKNYYFSSEAIDILQLNASRLPIRNVNANENGYGAAIKYAINPSLFVRSSFEYALRIPTEREIFGNFGSILPNFELRPERSQNYNLGIQYSKFLSGSREIFFQLDGFIRNQEDLIRPDAFGPENTIFINEAVVEGKGAEAAFRYSLLESLNLSANVTWQSNTIGSSEVQVPNVTRFFYNVGMRFTPKNIFENQKRKLEFFWNYFFTDRFSINEVPDFDSANPDFIIPAQHLHNTGIIYRMEDKHLSFSFNFQNVFNAEIFDNFRIPRPGINYNFKINYSL